MRLVIQNGRLRDSVPDFVMYKEYHCAIWGRYVRTCPQPLAVPFLLIAHDLNTLIKEFGATRTNLILMQYRHIPGPPTAIGDRLHAACPVHQRREVRVPSVHLSHLTLV